MMTSTFFVRQVIVVIIPRQNSVLNATWKIIRLRCAINSILGLLALNHTTILSTNGHQIIHNAYCNIGCIKF